MHITLLAKLAATETVAGVGGEGAENDDGTRLMKSVIIILIVFMSCCLL